MVAYEKNTRPTQGRCVEFIERAKKRIPVKMRRFVWPGSHCRMLWTKEYVILAQAILAQVGTAQGVSCSRGVHQGFHFFVCLCFVGGHVGCHAVEHGNTATISHQAWLKVLQGKRPPAEKWPRQSGAPKPGQPPVQPQPKIRGLHPDVKVSVARDRIAKLEAAIAAVGDEDETAPKLKEASRKARQQAQIPPIEVRVKSCEQFLDRARKNVLKAQEEVSKAQQFLMEAQKWHEERVIEVTEAERRLIMLQTEAASHVAIMKDPIQVTDHPDWAAELDKLRQKVNELQIENGDLANVRMRR